MCHSFHCECLRRWADSSCPVCRFVADEDAAEQTTCERCGRSEALWICLVCGHVGCGRYGCGAGVLHNRQSAHNYAMDVATQRVWDYAGDNYVHRLIQSKVDGKLVELPHPVPAHTHAQGGGEARAAAPAASAASLTVSCEAAALRPRCRRRASPLPASPLGAAPFPRTAPPAARQPPLRAP